MLVARPPHLKILEKDAGPVRRLLVLVDRPADEVLDAGLRSVRPFGPLTTLVYVDFAADPAAAEAHVLGRRLEARGRWFGVGTFVFDLGKSEAELFGAVAARERSKIRKSERDGIETVFSSRPSALQVDRFLGLYGAMAKERGLEEVDPRRLGRMFEDGHAVLAEAVKDGAVLTANVVYVTPEHGYYVHGAHDPSAKDPGGHLLHHRTLLHLKATGRRWYDFGMIASSDPEDGIHRFKRAFGGVLLASGREFQHAPPWLAVAAPVARALRDRLNALRAR